MGSDAESPLASEFHCHWEFCANDNGKIHFLKNKMLPSAWTLITGCSEILMSRTLMAYLSWMVRTHF